MVNRVSIYRGWCKKCEICTAFCPQKVLESDDTGYPAVARPEKCTGCKLCEMLCPDLAIVVDKDEDGDRKDSSAPGE